MVIRFRDYGKRLSDFEEEILVCCPQCDAYGGLRLRTAKVLTVNSEQSSLSSIKRITCRHCSYTKQQSKDGKRKAAMDQAYATSEKSFTENLTFKAEVVMKALILLVSESH